MESRIKLVERVAASDSDASERFFGGLRCRVVSEFGLDLSGVASVSTRGNIALQSDHAELLEWAEGSPTSEIGKLAYISPSFAPAISPILEAPPGDVLVNPSQGSSLMAGPSKLGSALGFLHGLRSLLDSDLLGLHASAVYDKDQERAHVFIGQSGNGKSTIARHLCHGWPSRFSLEADDWVSISLRDNSVQASSWLIGARPPKRDAEEAFRGCGFLCESYGKLWYRSNRVASERRELGLVFLLGSRRSIDPLLTLRMAMRQVPFVAQVLSETTTDWAQERVYFLCEQYLKLLEVESMELVPAGLEQNAVFESVSIALEMA